MALHDSGEVCLTVLLDAVADLSNSYLYMDFRGSVGRSLSQSRQLNFIILFVIAHTGA